MRNLSLISQNLEKPPVPLDLSCTGCQSQMRFHHCFPNDLGEGCLMGEWQAEDIPFVFRPTLPAWAE